MPCGALPNVVLKIELSVRPLRGTYFGGGCRGGGVIFRRGLSGSARNEVAGQINAATRAQYLVIIIIQTVVPFNYCSSLGSSRSSNGGTGNGADASVHTESAAAGRDARPPSSRRQPQPTAVPAPGAVSSTTIIDITF